MADLYSMTTNESAYGGIADSYAQKYGIPTSVFRDTIRQVSNFDPKYKSAKGQGIAGLTNKTGNKNLDPNLVGQSLDIAAQYIKQAYSESGDWLKASESFIGGDEEPKSLAENEAALNVSTKPQDESGDKAFWRYSSDDWKAFFSRSAWGMLFFVVGGVLIIASLYVVISKSGDSGK